MRAAARRAGRGLRRLAARSGCRPTPSGVALVAVGSLGRREPSPYSDLDLVLLHDGRSGAVAELADSIWYPIWDSGVGLDHSVRTPDQAIDVARDDLKALLGLLDLRHVAGDERARPARCAAGVLELWRATAPKRVDRAARAVRGALAARRRGRVPARTEPQGLARRPARRPLAARAGARAAGRPAAGRARGQHRPARRARRAAPRSPGAPRTCCACRSTTPIAASLGLRDAAGEPDRDEVLRRVNHAARTVTHALDTAFRRIEAHADAAPVAARGCFGSARPGRCARASPATSSRRTARWCSPATRRRAPTRDSSCARPAPRPRTNCRSPTYTLDRLAAEQAAPVPEPWPAEIRDDFVALLGTGPAAVPVLESLDLAGLLSRLIPEWDAVRSRAQHNPVHRFTVDRHLLETAAHAAEHTREVHASRPAAGRRAAARHRQGLPRRPLGRRRRARPQDRLPDGLRRRTTSR